MPTASQTPKTPQKPWLLWTGRFFSALPVLALVLSSTMKFARLPQVLEGMTKLGYPESTLLVLAVLELGSALIYAIPRTAVLGAILMTGYLGGAIATHVRVDDHDYPSALSLGILVWAGLYLRDERTRRLLPFRQAQDA